MKLRISFELTLGEQPEQPAKPSGPSSHLGAQLGFAPRETRTQPFRQRPCGVSCNDDRSTP